MRQDVERWCRLCDTCQHRNPRQGPKHSHLQQQPISVPMERIAIDFLSMPVTTDNGNCCILVVSDYFSKWTEAFALKDH